MGVGVGCSVAGGCDGGWDKHDAENGCCTCRVMCGRALGSWRGGGGEVD